MILMTLPFVNLIKLLVIIGSVQLQYISNREATLVFFFGKGNTEVFLPGTRKNSTV